jgi:hypothetical protein
MRIFISFTVLISSALASVPVRDGCTEDSTVLARVQDNDAIQVNHGMVGEALPCYAVSVTQSGSEIRGYVLGSTLPAIQEFERLRALESRVPLPPAPPSSAPGAPVEKKIAAPRPTGPPFEAWSGTSLNGHRITIAPGDAKVTLVTFWAAQSVAARRNMMNVSSEFRVKGLQSFGMVQAPDAGRANYYLDDMSLSAPQSLDRQRLAAKYNADPMKGTTLVLDSENHIIASSSNLAEIRAAVTKLLSSE